MIRLDGFNSFGALKSEQEAHPFSMRLCRLPPPRLGSSLFLPVFFSLLLTGIDGAHTFRDAAVRLLAFRAPHWPSVTAIIFVALACFDWGGKLRSTERQSVPRLPVLCAQITHVGTVCDFAASCIYSRQHIQQAVGGQGKAAVLCSYYF